MTLDQLPHARRGVITSLDTTGSDRRRLMDLGMVPGTTVRAELTSALGDPVAYDVHGSLIVLRRSQARSVHVDISE